MQSIHKVLFFISVTLSLYSYGGDVNQTIIIADDGVAGDSFGFSVAIDNETILVGANKVDVARAKDAGAAYVYVLERNKWQKQAKLIASPAFAGDSLGGNVSLKNNIAMLGVMRRDDKGVDSGAVISFERKAKIWKQGQIFTAPDAEPGDAFGQSTALTEHHLVIGAPRNDALGEDSGAVYIYKYENDVWHYNSKITASDGKEGDLFGISVAIDGNTILVGADLHDEKAENAGAVYVYVLDDAEWKQEAKLMASDGGKTDIFGVRVAISSNTALISARRDDIDGIGIDAGSAYIFERIGSTWSQTQKLISPDGKADDRFGRAVALNEGTAVISAMNHDANGINTGALYVYKKRSGGWRYKSKLVAKYSMPDDKFGWNIGLSNGVSVTSTPHYQSNGEKLGAIFIQDLEQ